MSVEMDTDKVQAMADGFEAASEILQGVSAALQGAMDLLKSTAFVGLVGGLAVERYLAFIKPKIDNLAAYCAEIHGDLEAAIQAYMRGDAEGATRFH